MLRTGLYYLLIAAFTIPWTLLMVAGFWLPHHSRRKMAVPWVRVNNTLMRYVVGIRYEVRGRENIPDRACVVLSKHQSSWETFVLQDVFPDTVFVWKKELKLIPFFGWALATQPSIAIDRSAGAAALRQLTREGAERLAQGYNVVVFPEGTRAPVGRQNDYKVGGALMAIKAKAPIVPVAHNSGDAWGASANPANRGLVTISIGPVIDTAGLGAADATARAERWIEAEMRRICPQHYPAHVATPSAKNPAA
jgi:1-acyl-sn-glycerol-3-phosphate acyltransferase